MNSIAEASAAQFRQPHAGFGVSVSGISRPEFRARTTLAACQRCYGRVGIYIFANDIKHSTPHPKTDFDYICARNLVSAPSHPVLEEEMEGTEERDMDKFDALDSGEKTIATIGDGWWLQTAK